MKRLGMGSIVAMAGLGAFMGLAGAEDLQRETVLPLSLAAKAATAAVEKCTQGGFKVSAAVVDRAGVIRVLMRADGAGSHTADSSRKKAYTAASLGRTTSELGELLVKMPNLQALREMNDNVLILGGGLPIQFGNEVVGGIGVGGAPGTHLDDACAQAGLDAIGAAPKVHPENK
jgi:uncharacterized protein GlcG (DUF336 family)